MTIKKWVPCALWDVTGLEQWLGEMAAKGYALKNWPGVSFIGRVSFQESQEALNARYRLDPIGERFSDLELQERSEAYKEVGWNYVGKISRLYAIYCCVDPTAPELYNDPESFAWAMKKQMRWLWVTLFLWFLYPLVLFWDELAMLFSYPQEFVMNFLLRTEILFPAYLIVLVLLMAAVADSLGTFWGIRRIQTILKRGDWPSAGQRSYPELRRIVRCFVVVGGSVAFMTYLGFSGALSDERLSGPEEWGFPHVLLEETIPSDSRAVPYSNRKMMHFDDFDNSFFTPEQYNVAQGAMVYYADGTSAETKVYQEHVRARSSAIAKAVYRGRLEAHRHALETYRINWEENTSLIHANFPNAFDYIKEEKLSYPGLDGVTKFTYLYSDEIMPNVVYIGLIRDRVFVLNCSGASDGESAMVLLTERLLNSTDSH